MSDPGWRGGIFACFSSDPTGAVCHAIERYAGEVGARAERIVLSPSMYYLFRRQWAAEVGLEAHRAKDVVFLGVSVDMDPAGSYFCMSLRGPKIVDVGIA